MGGAVVRMNFRFQGSEHWETLTYSLKESLIRVNTALVTVLWRTLSTTHSIKRADIYNSLISYETKTDAVQTFLG